MDTATPTHLLVTRRPRQRGGLGRFGWVVVVAACTWAGGAGAQSADVYALSRQVAQLQQDLAQLQPDRYTSPGYTSPGQSTGRGGPIDLSPAYRERVEVRLAEMESELRELTGRVEEATFAVRRLEDRLEKLVEDVDFRLAALERGGMAAADGAPTGLPAPLPTESADGEGGPAPSGEPRSEQTANLLPAGSAAEEYEQAQRLLTQGRYDEAETALRGFLDRHPDHQLSDNARYWLAESYYVRKRYEEAASAFLDSYKRAPTGGKAPDNLLKLGLSLDALDKDQEACVAINKLLREHPDSPDHVRRRAEQERQSLNCT